MLIKAHNAKKYRICDHYAKRIVMRKVVLMLSLSPLIVPTTTKPDVLYDFFTAAAEIFGQPSKPQIFDNSISIEEYCNTARHILRYLPLADQNAIVDNVQTRLYQKGHVSREEADSILKYATLERNMSQNHQGASAYFYDERPIEKFVNSQKNNVEALLKKSKTIDSKALAPYFNPENVIRSIEKSAAYEGYREYLKPEWHALLFPTPTPKPVSNPTPAYVRPLDGTYYQSVADMHVKDLAKAGMDAAQLKEYKDLFWSSKTGCSQDGYTSLEGIVRCSKCKIRDVLEGGIKERHEAFKKANPLFDKARLQAGINSLKRSLDGALPDDSTDIKFDKLRPFMSKHLDDTIKIYVKSVR